MRMCRICHQPKRLQIDVSMSNLFCGQNSWSWHVDRSHNTFRIYVLYIYTSDCELRGRSTYIYSIYTRQKLKKTNDFLNFDRYRIIERWYTERYISTFFAFRIEKTSCLQNVLRRMQWPHMKKNIKRVDPIPCHSPVRCLSYLSNWTENW